MRRRSAPRRRGVTADANGAVNTGAMNSGALSAGAVSAGAVSASSRHALAIVMLSGMLACTGTPARDPQPAVLTDPSPATRAALAKAVHEALHGTPVRLADDALVHDSVLLIEPVTPRDAAGLPLQGRELRAPDRFQLIKQGSSCILIYAATGRRFPLRPAVCVPAISH